MLIRKGPSAALSKEQFDELGDLSKTPLIMGNPSTVVNHSGLYLAPGSENYADSLVEIGS